MNTKQDFESWATANHYRDLRAFEIGGYIDQHTLRAWNVWQAATSRQETKIKVLAEALEGVAMMARCGQLDKFIGEPWLNAVHKALTATKETP